MTTTPALTGAERTAAKIGYLSKTDLFQDLTPPELAEIERKITMHTCERGRVFYLPGETGEVLYILKEGRVQLYRLSAEGRKLVLAILEPGTVFGEMSMIGQGMYDAFAEAAEPCTICVMSRRDVEALIRSKPQIALRLLELVAVRMQELETQLEDIAFRSVPVRLATLLLRLAGDSKDEAPIAATVGGLTHQDLADMLGVYRETVTTALDKFRNNNLIAIGRRQLVLRNVPRLRELAAASR
ncbi:MAG: Crp/Fnr family transcriptional regulator [Chloroflexota bacterium]|nr:Crp/Fnr family transcriptional regulator [Chloroflexota bacterium]